MIGGGVYAHTILGVAYDEAAGTYSLQKLSTTSVAKPESGAFMAPWIRIRDKFFPIPDSTINISQSLVTSFLSSVADPKCLSRILLFSIPDPNFFHTGSRSA
jgi:hypothetical protein